MDNVGGKYDLPSPRSCAGVLLFLFVGAGSSVIAYALYLFVTKVWFILLHSSFVESSVVFHFQNPLSALFGAVAFFLHLAGYFLYGKEVLNSNIRPNVVTWIMWLFGGIVELITYDAIPGSHWSASALPLACTLGIFWVCTSIAIAQYRNSRHDGGVVYHRPVKSDYALLAFDSIAGVIWLLGYNPILANAIAVSTTIATFVPIWRTTHGEPESEDPGPWALWSIAYLMMAGAVMTSGSNTEIGLYFLPLYYFILHFIVLILSLRSKHIYEILRSASTNLQARFG